MKRRFYSAALLVLLAGILSAPKPIIDSVAAQPEVPCSYDSDASWSPLGDRIAFISGRSGNFDIWVMEPDGTNPVNLTADNLGYDGDMSWSLDGKLLAFSSERKDSIDIWVMEIDSLDSINLTRGIEGEKAYPRWSPDGKHIAFVATRNGKYEVWVMDADGANPRQVSPANDLSFLAPSWLTNDQVVFLDRTHVSARVWKTTLDTEELTSLDSCAPEFNVLNIEASHAANMIAFLNRNDGDIWIIDATDYRCRNLTMGEGGSIPVWSSDGRFIAFHSLRDGKIDIWTMTSDGSDQRNLTNGRGGYYPDWSPDNSQIVFTSVTNGDPDVWIINADGTEPRNLTAGQNICR